MLTLASVISRHFSPSRLPRAGRAIRLFLVLFALGGVSACGDATGLSRVDGTYSLRSVDGQLLPASNGSTTLQDGILRLDNGAWDLELRFSQGSVVDYGSYRRSGSTIEFDSNRYQDFFEGTLYSSRTVYVRYDLGSTIGIVELEFRR